MQIVYLMVLNGCFIVWLISGEPKLPVLLGGNINYIAILGVVICHGTFRRMQTGPGHLKSYKAFATALMITCYSLGYGLRHCRLRTPRSSTAALVVVLVRSISIWVWY
jgi:hypothetical protein